MSRKLRSCRFKIILFLDKNNQNGFHFVYLINSRRLKAGASIAAEDLMPFPMPILDSIRMPRRFHEIFFLS